MHIPEEEVLYLGHLVSREGIATDPGKISKIAGWPVPTMVQEVQRFLRFAATIDDLSGILQRLLNHYTG